MSQRREHRPGKRVSPQLSVVSCQSSRRQSPANRHQPSASQPTAISQHMSAMQLSAAVQTLKPSATIAAASKAKELKQQGTTVYEFTLGEPDFSRRPTSVRRLRPPSTPGRRTTRRRGELPALKQAVAAAFTRGTRDRLRSDAGARLQRGEALDSQRADRAVRAGRRGHHPDALLGELLGSGRVDAERRPCSSRRPKSRASACRPSSSRRRSPTRRN